MLRFVCLIAVAMLAGFPGTADAGAWTKRKHEGLFISGLGFHWLNAQSQPGATDSTKLEASLYLEYGLTDRVTLVARGGYQEIHQAEVGSTEPARKLTGFGGLEVGARIGVLDRERWAGALQILAGIPGSGENWINEAFGARGGDLDIKAQLGRSLGDSAFVEVGSGIRLRGEEAANELRFNATAGCDFVWNTSVMVQTYSVWALDGNRTQPAYSGHRVQASLLVPIWQQNTLQISTLRTVARQDMSEETAVLVSIWRDF